MLLESKSLGLETKNLERRTGKTTASCTCMFS